MKSYFFIASFRTLLLTSPQSKTTPLKNIGIAKSKRSAQLNYQDLPHQLGVIEARASANGRGSGVPNAVNYDETKANPSPDYAHTLVFNNVNPVTTEIENSRAREIQIT